MFKSTVIIPRLLLHDNSRVVDKLVGTRSSKMAVFDCLAIFPPYHLRPVYSVWTQIIRGY